MFLGLLMRILRLSGFRQACQSSVVAADHTEAMAALIAVLGIGVCMGSSGFFFSGGVRARVSTNSENHSRNGAWG